MTQTGLIRALVPLPDRPAWVRGPRPVRDLAGLPPVLARVGAFELRLATTKKEVRKVQRLRFEVFYEAGDAVPDAYAASLRRDKCPFDRVCDHLVVVDTAARSARGTPKARVVGTYRVLRDAVASAEFGFYSESAFVLEPMLDRHAGTRFLELGRSCVHPAFRARRVIDLLWHGIGLYAAHHRSQVLIGCASLPGTQGEALAVPLSYAFHHAASPAAWQVEAVPARAVRMDWIAKAALDERHAITTLPPLVKAYRRAGGTFAAEAAVDHQFGTTDLFTILPLASASPRYLAQFAPLCGPASQDLTEQPGLTTAG